MITPSLRLITPSYRRDLEQCRNMCASVDRFAPDFEHMLIVPSRDLPLFKPLGSSKRTIVAVEDILRSKRLWRKRERWRVGSVRTTGWVTQQIVKIEAARRTGGIAVFVDSDVTLIRPLTRDHYIKNGRLRFYCDRSGSVFDIEN